VRLFGFYSILFDDARNHEREYFTQLWDITGLPLFTNDNFLRIRNYLKYDRNPGGLDVDTGDGDTGIGHSEGADKTARV
jgi:hypothetical protein